MKRNEKENLAVKLSSDFVKMCEGMSVGDAYDLLQMTYLFSLEQMCNSTDEDLRKVLCLSRDFIEGIILELNNKNIKMN